MTLQEHLTGKNEKLIALIAAVAAFGTYSCMYAFRKPFTVATFDAMVWLGIDYKIWLIFAQTVGYTLSKFYGVKFISEMGQNARSRAILMFILLSWLALLMFPLIPQPFNILLLFVNGFPLGMVWGLVFSYLEGRRYTEFMGAFLSVSFIFSSGLVKSVGAYLMVNFQVSQWWMPCLTGLVFAGPLLLFTWLLDQTPQPTKEDITLRNKRVPMTREDRLTLLKSYGFGIAMLIAGYVLLTLLRDIRDNFVSNIWLELGFEGESAIFTTTEVPVSIAVLVIISSLVLVKNNIKALIINHIIIIIGFLIILVTTILFSKALITPVTWMIAIGLGLYMAYVPFNCVIFERFMAVFRHTGNAGFLIYLADSFGYLGSVSFLFYKELGGFKHTSWTEFFSTTLVVASVIGVVTTFVASIYFYLKHRAGLKILERQIVLTP
ncbi:DUF5690 family protein [Fulvivirgaceae bacterium BMA12]|uniref:DUF5690 family protein n=1 Tax=Agaribacillus aureus TaxID=3051825 RepID=A0ABT8L7J2_9BACT|nr:DUF5690 family protein [Fulvivirgaceae bacterium BMA12]